jgi:hypothetical protein
VIQRENAGLLLAAAEQREELDKGQQPCVWTEDMDGLWESICSNHGPFQFFDGGPIDNHVAFCPYCGHPITAVSYSETIEQQIATLTAERDEARQHCEDLKAAYIQGLTKPTRQQLQEFGARGDTKDDNT